VKPLEDFHEVTTDSAADAAVHNFDDLFIDRLSKNFFVNSNLAKFIFDDGEFHAMGRVIEDMVQKGCLTRPQET
jgi:hypothetical protein